MTTRLRPATVDDVPFLAWVAIAAARSHVERGAWDLIVPESDRERQAFVAAVLRARPSWCHWGSFRIAEVDGEPAAALAGYPVADEAHAKPEEVLAEVARAEGWSDHRLAGAFARMMPFLGAVPKENPEAWAVEWVATDPGFRRRGLVARLLDEVLEDGRRRGHAAAQLLLLIGNAPAQGVYERVGFRIVDEARSPEFEAVLGCPGIARMEVPL